MNFGTAERIAGKAAPAAEARSQALEVSRTTLLKAFHDAGYRSIETPLLFPSSTFLDFSGEAIRSRLFLTADSGGQELCLRPEYTIPVCLSYIRSGSCGKPASYAYCGPVFRAEANGPGQFLQSGLEDFGRDDTASADAEVLVIATQAAAQAGFADIEVRTGDAGLLARLLDTLDISPAWQRRLKRGLDAGLGVAALAADAPPAGHDHSGVVAALTGTDQQGARALVEDLLSIAGIASVGGRSAGEIAERFLAQVAAKASPGFGDEQRRIVERYLKITGHPDDATVQLRALAAEANLDLTAALDLFEERANFLAAQDLAVESLTFDAAFARNLDYYTGFIFEARRARGTGEVVIGGGRYDRLAQALGAAEPIPAVGASIWVERLRGGAKDLVDA